MHDRSNRSADRSRRGGACVARQRGCGRSRHPLRRADKARPRLDALGLGRRRDRARRTRDLRRHAHPQARERARRGAARAPRRPRPHDRVRRPQRTLAGALRHAAHDWHDRDGDRAGAAGRRVAGLSRRLRQSSCRAAGHLHPPYRDDVLRHGPPRPAQRLCGLQPRRPGRLHAGDRRRLLAVDRSHRCASGRKRPGGDAAALARQRRLADPERRRPRRLAAARRDLVPRDAARAPRLRSARGARRRASRSACPPRCRCAETDCSPPPRPQPARAVPAARSPPSGTLTGSFRTRFAGWGARTAAFGPAGFARYAHESA